MGLIYALGIFLLMIVIVLVLSGLSILGMIMRVIFGSPFKKKNKSRPENNPKGTAWYTTDGHRRKVFDTTEGEYVEYEEIKKSPTE